MRYRPEIDGLRAVAVIPVILFHAGFKLFGGGFVGVDVFFVISGYLITSIILPELKDGKFSIIRFYERRARRILPALFLVMAVCLPFAWLWLVPEDMEGFSRSLIAVATFSSNIFFWRTSGYFETASELKPLLHTWSLAVEEQYYVVFPIFLLIVWRFGKKWIIALTAIAAIGSLALAEWAVVAAPVANYFLLPTRGWELLIGALIAFHFDSCKRSSLEGSMPELLGWIGVLLLTYAIFAFDSQTPYPSIYTLIPTAGTALIILFANRQTAVGKILSQRIIVGIGLVSYSAYLWHQPLFAFARNQNLSEPSNLAFGLLSLASLALGYFSYRYVETPFRNKILFSRKQIFSFSALAGSCFIALGMVGLVNKGFEGRYKIPQNIEYSFRTTNRSKECFDKNAVQTRADWLCDIGIETEAPSFVIFGDSHALSLFDVFDEAAKELNQYGIFTGASGCTPLLGIYALRNDQAQRNCYLLNKRVLDYVEEKKIAKVFLVARWTYYTDGGYDGNDFSYIGLAQSDKASKETSRKAFVLGLQETVDAYKRIGAKLHLVTQVPQQKYDPVKLYYKLYDTDRNLFLTQLETYSISKDLHTSLQAFVMEKFKSFEESGAVNLVNFDNILCKDKCLVGDSDKSYYEDNNHLSVEGGKLLVGELKSYLVQKGYRFEIGGRTSAQ